MDARIPTAAERRLFEDRTGAILDAEAEIQRHPGVKEVKMDVCSPVDMIPVAQVVVVMDKVFTSTDEQETVRLVHQVISRYGINMRQVQVVHEAHERWPPSDYVPVSPSYSPKSPLYAPEPDPEAEPDPDEEGTPPSAKRTKGPTPVARDEA